MIKQIFSPSPVWFDKGLALIRIIVGALMIYHGKEIFQPDLMKGYAEWEMFKGDYGLIKVYIGKGSEFVAGILIMLGWFTRVGAIITIGTFAYITFFVGHGKFYYEDQHPFMFLLMGLLFFFSGSGVWSVDGARK